MSTFWMWRFPKSGRSPEPARVSWLCGPERGLVEEVLDYLRADLGRMRQVESYSFDGGDPGVGRELWSAANQYPLAPELTVRLIVVRAADKLENWAPLEGWADPAAGRTLPGVHLVFVSDADDFPLVATKDAKRPLQSHVQTIQKRGAVIRCAMPGEGNGKVIVAWIQHITAMPEQTARHLIERTGGDLDDIRDACAKLACLDGVPGEAVIDQLCPLRPADSFVDALSRRDKPEALAALETLPETDYGSVIGLLNYRLTALGVLHTELRKGKTARDLALDKRVPQFIVAGYRDVAKEYDPRTVGTRRTALAVIDSALRSGASGGVLESLVVLW